MTSVWSYWGPLLTWAVGSEARFLGKGAWEDKAHDMNQYRDSDMLLSILPVGPGPPAEVPARRSLSAFCMGDR
jgi:hypothetical protein